jgi:predicted transglutaminase-like cysteine proteinase
MSTITVTVTDDRHSELKEIAARFGITVEELVQLSVEDLLAQPEATFRRAKDYVLNKNRDLYQRLA